MIVADTSVWVDFFRGEDNIYAAELWKLIHDINRITICGIILQEVLRGIRVPKSYEVTRERLLKLPFLEANRKIHLAAEHIFRDLRRRD